MTSFGRYHIESLLGSGGMAEVHRATDTALDRQVALKLPHAHFDLDPRAKARFLQEGRSIAGLSHENIVHLYDAGEYEGRLYLAMEWVPGLSLDRWLEKTGPFPPLSAYSLLVQLLSGLTHAHGKGIWHRDIKPANLILSETGLLKIADFGLSRLLHAESVSLTGQFIGTPKYASPEMSRGEPLTDKSDVFSSALVALEILHGRPVITAEDPQAALLQIREGRFVDSLTLSPHAPVGLHSVLRAMLAPDPTQRPSAGEAHVQLESFAWDKHLRIHPQAVAHFLADPEAARGEENRILGSYHLSEAKAASSQGQLAAARKFTLLAEELGGETGSISSEEKSPPPLAKAEKTRAEKRVIPFSLLALALIIGGLWLVWPGDAPSPSKMVIPIAAPTPEDSTQSLENAPEDSVFPAAPEKAFGPEVKTRVEKPSSHTPVQPPVAPSRPAWIRILSRPSFAQITLDGEAAGQTPSAWIVLEPGRHDFTLTHPGCFPLHDSLVMAPAESLEIRRELQRLP